MDFGGGKINKKEIFVVLTLISLALPLSMNLVSATTPQSAVNQDQSVTADQSITQNLTGNPTTTSVEKREQNTDKWQNTSQPMAAGENSSAAYTTTTASVTSAQLYDAASSVKTFVDNNHRLPNFVTISGQQITIPQFLQLLTEGLLNLNGQNNTLSVDTVLSPTNPSETVRSGNVQKTEYVQLAQNLNNFVDTNGRLPNYVTSSIGKIRFESLVYVYSKVLDFYDTNGRLPTYVSISSWASQSSEGSNSTITDPSLQKYLVPTKNCQSNSSTIISKANSITAGLTSTYSKAQAVFNWVRDHTAYSYYENTKKGALGTLSSGSANCCDHSHLVIALARAVGIPGRYVHVYNHVYSQLYVNGVWYNADAINNSNYFGQPKSSAILGIYAELPF